MKKIVNVYNITTKAVDTEKYTLEAVFSSSKVDRHGDIVMQNFDLKNFKKNPVILNSHTYGDATEVIGKAEKIGIKDGQLEGKIKFAVNENPKAKIIFDLYAGGFLNAFSVGFIPLDFNDKGEISKSELLEVSAVAVPANAMALAKSKGIEVEKLYDEENNKADTEEAGSADEVTDKVDTGGEEVGKAEDKAEESEEQVEDNDEVKEVVEDEDTEEESDCCEDCRGEDKQEDVGSDKGSEEESEEEVAEQVDVKTLTIEEKKQLLLNKIAKGIGLLGELNKKVVPPQQEVRAKNIRLINKAITNLLKEKRKI